MTRAAPPNSVIRSDIVSIIIPDKLSQKIYKKVHTKKTREIQKIIKKFHGLVQIFWPTVPDFGDISAISIS